MRLLLIAVISMMFTRILAVVISILFLSIPIVFCIASPNTIYIAINEDGVAFVSIEAVAPSGFYSIELPIEPISSSIDVESNASIEWLYQDNTLYVFSPTTTLLNISYIANTSIENSVISFEIKTSNIVKMALHPLIILLTMPENITRFEVLENKWILIEFTTPTKIAYTIATPTLSPAPSPLPTPTPTPTPVPGVVTVTVKATSTVTSTAISTSISTAISTTTKIETVTEWTTTTIISIVLLIVGFAIAWLIKRK